MSKEWGEILLSCWAVLPTLKPAEKSILQVATEHHVFGDNGMSTKQRDVIHEIYIERVMGVIEDPKDDSE